MNKDGKVYYFGNDGAMYQNRYYKNWGNTYYFGADGARYTDQFMNKDGKVYYFGNDGAMYQNRYYKNWGNTYYFGADGARYTDQFMNKDGKVYYFGNDGAMYQNRYYKNWGNTYYFGADGVRYTNQLLYLKGNDDNSQTHYFDDQGRMVTNNWAYLQGVMLYFDNNGFPVNGKQTINGQTYLFKDYSLVPSGNYKITYNRYLSTLVGLYQNANWFKENANSGHMLYGVANGGVNKGYHFITANGDPTSWIYFKEDTNNNKMIIKYLDSTTDAAVANKQYVEKIVPINDLTSIYDQETNATMISEYANKLSYYENNK